MADKIPVLFRVWKDDSDVFALFPTLPVDDYNYLCTSYAPVGQHGAAEYQYCVRSSRPAREEEYAPLLRELVSIGYNMRVVKRAPRRK